MFLHVPIHGAQFHLPPEVDVHRALLHSGIDEFIRRVSQLEKKMWIERGLKHLGQTEMCGGEEKEDEKEC